MKEINVEAKIENLTVVSDFLHQITDELICPMGIVMQLEIAIEELFANICYYAYGDDGGSACIQIDVEEDPTAITIAFIDSGKPYDPLAKEDPDTTLSAEDRPIGGLGIFMVKKSMDDITYEYRNEKNILKIKKILNSTSNGF